MSLGLEENSLSTHEDPALSMEDLELLEKGKAGSFMHMVILHNRHDWDLQRAAFNLAKRYNLTAEDARDAVQEVWLHLLQEQISIEIHFRNYFVRAVHNTLRMVIRRSKSRIQPVSLTRLSDDFTGESESQLREKSQQNDIWEQVDRLGDDYRTVMQQKFRMGLSIEEIAKQLELPEGTVKRRIHTAKAILRNEFADVINNPSSRLHQDDPPRAVQHEHRNHEDDVPALHPSRLDMLDELQRRVGHPH